MKLNLRTFLCSSEVYLQVVYNRNVVYPELERNGMDIQVVELRVSFCVLFTVNGYMCVHLPESKGKKYNLLQLLLLLNYLWTHFLNDSLSFFACQTV